MNSKKWMVAATGGLIFLVTAMAGWQLSGSSRLGADGFRGNDQESQVPRRVARRSKGGNSAAKAARMMRMLRQADTPEERMRATIELVNNLPISEMGAWMDGNWFDLREGFDLTLFHKIAMERWRLEDPEGLVRWSLKSQSGVGNEILASWAEREPQRVIDYFRGNPNELLELNALAGIAKTNPSLALERLREMSEAGLSLAAMRQSNSLLAELAKSSPEALDGLLDSLPDTIRTAAETSLVAERMKEGFSGEMGKLMDRPDGWLLFRNAFSQSGVSVEMVINQLDGMPAAWRNGITSNFYAFNNATNAKLWLAADLEGSGFSDEQVKRIRQQAIRSMGSANPIEALGMIDEMEGGSRQSLITNAINRIARDPEKLEPAMAMLANEEDRATAQAIIDRANGTSTSPGAAVVDPQGWLEKASQSERNQLEWEWRSKLGQMDSGQLGEVLSEFRKMPDEDRKSAALAIEQSARNFDNGQIGIRPLRAEAIGYLVGEAANATDSNSRVDMTASRFAVDWMKQDPQAAGEWARSLSAGETRLAVQKNLALNWAHYDPAAARQWVDSLPSAERSAVSEVMENHAGN